MGLVTSVSQGDEVWVSGAYKCLVRREVLKKVEFSPLGHLMSPFPCPDHPLQIYLLASLQVPQYHLYLSFYAQGD